MKGWKWGKAQCVSWWVGENKREEEEEKRGEGKGKRFLWSPQLLKPWSLTSNSIPREFCSLWESQIPQATGKVEWGGGNGGNPLILLPLTSLRHTSVSSFLSLPILLYVIHTELHSSLWGVHWTSWYRVFVYTLYSLLSTLSSLSVSSARSFLLFLQMSLRCYFLLGAGTLLLCFHGPFPTYPIICLWALLLCPQPSAWDLTHGRYLVRICSMNTLEAKGISLLTLSTFPLLNRPNVIDHQTLFSECHSLVSILLSSLDHWLNLPMSPRVSLLLHPISLHLESFCGSLLPQINIQPPWLVKTFPLYYLGLHVCPLRPWALQVLVLDLPVSNIQHSNCNTGLCSVNVCVKNKPVT